MKSNINVVIGATGRLGYALCMEIKAREGFLRVLCRETSPLKEKLTNIADEIVYGDVTDINAVSRAVSGAKVVYHLAAIVSIQSKPNSEIERVNVGGTKNVVTLCKEEGIRLVYVSSVHAVDFENTSDTLVEPERFNPDKVSGEYAKSKAVAGNMVLDAVNDGLDGVIALPSGIIGPYEYSLSNFGQMIADVINKKMKFYIKGGYDFVDVRDVSLALCDLAQKGICGQSYFITGHKLNVRELLNIAADSAGVKRPSFYVPSFLVRIYAPFAERASLRRGKKPTFTTFSLRVLSDNSNFSHRKLTDLTGYSPRKSEESIADQVNFFRKEFLEQ